MVRQRENMMQDSHTKLIQAQRDEAHLANLAARLLQHLVEDLNQPGPGNPAAPAFTASRVRALLRSAGVLDEPTWNDFSRLAQTEQGMRLALYDVLEGSGLVNDEEVAAIAQVNAQAPAPDPAPAVEWLPLAVAAFAWKRQYPLYQLDPALPPEPHSPAGQILKDTAFFIRQQVQRSATDRDKLARKLAYDQRANTASLEAMQPETPIPPLPPHFRPPIPVRYPEYARETVEIQPEDLQEPVWPESPPVPPPPPVRGEPLRITEEDLSQLEPRQPQRMPAIRIDYDQIRPEPQRPPSPLPPSGVIMPTPSRSTNPEARSGLTMALRNAFRTEQLKSTKLRVVIQEYPDGPGLYGLQVKITCRGIRSFVAGTSDREGLFVAELPVRESEGLTYDVDVTWPREMGGETERKSITLNADRTQFVLPFYRRLE